MAEANKLGILSAKTGDPVDVLIDMAMRKHGNNIAMAALELGVSRQALHRRLRLRQRAGEAAKS